MQHSKVRIVNISNLYRNVLGLSIFKFFCPVRQTYNFSTIAPQSDFNSA